jgi:peptide/nickel transport system permease protein
LRGRLGLSDPFWLQYLRWFGGAVRGDFGISMRTGQLVPPVILEALSHSLLLAFFSIGLMLDVAIPLGVPAATRGAPQSTGAIPSAGYYGTDAAHLQRSGDMQGIVCGP